MRQCAVDKYVELGMINYQLVRMQEGGLARLVMDRMDAIRRSMDPSEVKSAAMRLEGLKIRLRGES